MDFEQWMLENFEPETLADITDHGCVAGWPGLTYYSDTCKLYDEHEDEIWEKLYTDADDFGHKNPLELIASFCGADQVNGDAQFKNLLVWYIAERTARQITEAE